MSKTNPPPVAPVEGHYARMRDGAVVGPIRNAYTWYTTSTDKWGCWHTDFLWDDSGRLTGKAYDPDLDIIATISPADMQAVANGELERLRAAAKLALDAFYKCVEWSGTTDFDHEIAALEAALTTGDKP